MALSYDELFCIFSRLPAKAIYKFSCVDKFFSKLPKDAYFALRQAQNALRRNDTCFFIQPDIPIKALVYCSLQVELHQLPGEELSSGVSKNVLRYFCNSSVKILGSNNGLLLCCVSHEEQLKLFIRNPATQSHLLIPTPMQMQNRSDIYDHRIGFHSDLDGSYMVYLFVDDVLDWSSYFVCMVYHSNQGVWKTKEGKFFSGNRSLRFDMPVHHRGAVHFISDCFPYLIKSSPYFIPYIMSYNFENGTSRMMRVPKEARKGSHDPSCDMRIFKWGNVSYSSQDESICVVRLRKQVFTVWALRQHESSLWKKVLKIRIKAMGIEAKDPSQIIVKDFSVLNGHLLVFATKDKLYAYGLNDTRIHKIWEHHSQFNHLRFTSYKDTLRKCDHEIKHLSLLSNM
ncbi:unnamed protein product [Sphenostylis stenocarpa]|uniref:F-box protein At3g26010-like beta-propeller domain-containing protein n=1 Tax=Sphenostylis stenocarpa TaxID=92480 RepID=A0AA86RZ83_9FABA|nr:unnamed protein product [Sphenostylis stenocarpa]CAJ1920347.1 unnamed protein product [Sphenostylis stenocarpa]CAJ1920351.1 unnamed protein product [Sphenostylis stenocarpa]CAJ1920358.1 unnamed protein product [Sphenostylis stenocarpa]CAJ1920406.1 unnamed protein product [Sphenostylis stenocarpa]